MLTILIVAGGSGVFLRLIAKEKNRRDRYLQIRLAEKTKELEKEAGRHKWSKSSDAVKVDQYAQEPVTVSKPEPAEKPILVQVGE